MVCVRAWIQRTLKCKSCPDKISYHPLDPHSRDPEVFSPLKSAYCRITDVIRIVCVEIYFYPKHGHSTVRISIRAAKTVNYVKRAAFKKFSVQVTITKIKESQPFWCSLSRLHPPPSPSSPILLRFSFLNFYGRPRMSVV